MFPCEWCGWMPQDCTCTANKVTLADLDARHAQAVERANTPQLVEVPEVVVVTPWLRGTVGHHVVHRFRESDGRSVCGRTSMQGHGRVLRATAFDRRCAKCVLSINAAASRMAVAA